MAAEEQSWPVRTQTKSLTRPRSATHGAVAFLGMLSLLLCFELLYRADPFDDAVQRVLFLCAVPAGVMLLAGWFIDPPPQHMPADPAFGLGPSLARCAVKCLGFAATIGAVALLYWLFPEYAGNFYDRYWQALKFAAVPVLILGLPYIYLTDRRMSEPRDGYWAMGMLALLQFGQVDWGKLWQHCLGWLVKGYFLPLMFIYSFDDVSHFLAVKAEDINGFKPFYELAYNSLYLFDVIIAGIGYVFALRLFGTHIRSVEPSTIGWVSALVCYPPFWNLIGKNYIVYDTGYEWGAWLGPTPLLYLLWGCAILFLVGVYVWATFSFGCRFSNLTHRGIITNGPYRWTKHPAYLAKNLSWWMISIPFLAHGPAKAVQACAGLVLLNFIYFLRARTEERHLSLDPDYRQYAAWISRHGLLRWMPPLFPGMLDPLPLKTPLDEKE